MMILPPGGDTAPHSTGLVLLLLHDADELIKLQTWATSRRRGHDLDAISHLV